jgi:protein-S-isoprenylcysteine O-methyltransferase Ste14
MEMKPFHVMASLWIIWLVAWMAASYWAKPTRWREGWRTRAAYMIPLLIGAFLLALPSLTPQALRLRIFPLSPIVEWLGVVFVAAGLFLCVWARICLGRNWSGVVTLKEEHELVRFGPYRRVRHPIYSGLILAFIGTALTIGEVRASLALIFFVTSFVYKARVEERLMRSTFPGYAQYCEESWAIVPYIY